MLIGITKNDVAGGYDLTVDGKRYIEGESFAIVDRVADELRGSRPRAWGEIKEVADSIRRAHAVE